MEETSRSHLGPLRTRGGETGNILSIPAKYQDDAKSAYMRVDFHDSAIIFRHTAAQVGETVHFR